MGLVTDVRNQAVTGVVSPQQGEALIREVYPSVARRPAVARLGRKLTGTILLAPLAWGLMFFAYFLKVLPGFARRYTLTNRRLCIRRGQSPKLNPSPHEQVPLADIDEVRLVTDDNSTFFRAATLEIMSKGKVVLSLPGVPDPESFRHAILNACIAWVPGKTAGPFLPASAAK
jgi:hypothetical protein